ncbi:MAG: hypothetical protein R6V54_15155 [Desulfobacteraceae bacterium]
MHPSRENRKSRRIDHDARFICAFPETGSYHSVRLRNYSDRGLSFETLRKMVPGEVVLLHSRGGALPEQEDPGNVRKFAVMAHARVKWCASVEKCRPGYLGVGAEYVTP